jgi:hypothetical protein
VICLIYLFEFGAAASAAASGTTTASIRPIGAAPPAGDDEGGHNETTRLRLVSTTINFCRQISSTFTFNQLQDANLVGGRPIIFELNGFMAKWNIIRGRLKSDDRSEIV